jgi:uncharacterized metal-binding protein YceD (DUF177 family)
MGNPLLHRAPPEEFAARGQVIETTEKLGLFPRLAEMVSSDFRAHAPGALPAKWQRAQVTIRLAFGWADTEHEIPVLEGRVSAKVPAVCQRCLEPFGLKLDSEIRLLFGTPGEGADRTSEYELWELDEDTVRPLDILDENLVMLMPLAAMHEARADCGPLARQVTGAGDTGIRPFADLKSQLRHDD